MNSSISLFVLVALLSVGQIDGLFWSWIFGRAKVAEDITTVTLHLNTRLSPNTSTVVNENNLNAVNTNRSLKLIIHGHQEDANKDWLVSMKDEYLTKGNYNVIRVDWSSHSKLLYDYSALKVKDVAKVLCGLITKLKNTHGLRLSRIHCVGSSLGAHICGVMGNEVYAATNAKIGRISGLDPAGPLFEIPQIGASNRLSSDSATCVCVTHTDAGFRGYSAPLGLVDYYPNEGKRYQPGCTSTGDEVCSQMKSVDLFIHSINNNNLQATRCSSAANYNSNACSSNPVIRYGENCPYGKTGTFYFKTNSARPYSNV